MANDINLTDMETCYKAVRADVLHDLRPYPRPVWHGARDHCPTRPVWARIYEVPISYYGRTYAEGKSIGGEMGSGLISPWQARLFGFLMPLARLVDRLTFLPGLILIVWPEFPDLGCLL
jgi:hypothetical protein